MGVVCFRIKADDDATADRMNSRAVEVINGEGNTYLMQTKLRGRNVMRLGLGNLLTHEANVQRAWEIIQRTVSDLAALG